MRTKPFKYEAVIYDGATRHYGRANFKWLARWRARSTQRSGAVRRIR